MVIHSVPIDRATMPKIWKIKLDTFWTKLCQLSKKKGKIDVRDRDWSSIFDEWISTDQSIFHVRTLIADGGAAEAENAAHQPTHLATQRHKD